MENSVNNQAKNHFSSLAQCGDSKRRGFTLTEFAIVLGVIGSVLALVWTAATTTWEMARREQATEAVVTVANNMRALYSGQYAVPFIGVKSIIPMLFKNGAIPNSMQRKQSSTCSNVGNLCADTPWGALSTSGGVDPNGTFQVCAWNFVIPATQFKCETAAAGRLPSQFFGVHLSGLSQENCMKLATYLSGVSTLPGLMQVVINTKSVIPTATPATAKTDCGTGTANTVVFIYRLQASSG